jgi:hypothetical protein
LIEMMVDADLDRLRARPHAVPTTLQ